MKLIFSTLLTLMGFGAMNAQSTETSFQEQIDEHREDYKKDFLSNERSPLKEEDLANLRFFEPDKTYLVHCTFQRTPGEQPFELPTYSGRTQTYQKYGVLFFELKGKPYKLAVYKNLRFGNVPGSSDHLFLPFRDLTNDETTYGGGRYIDMSMKVVEGEDPLIDFNKCYNPWCHYSDGYNCPIPPVENILNVAIEAGEKLWVGEKKHK